MSAQAFDALRVANERRAAMREIRLTIERLDLRAGCKHVTALLADPTENESAMPIGRLLLSIDKFGAQSMAAVLRSAGVVSADRRVRDLTDRQRQALGFALGRRASTYRCRNGGQELSECQLAALRLLGASRCAGAGAALAHDLATRVGASRHGMSQKLVALERRGLVSHRLVRGSRRSEPVFGWEITAAGVTAIEGAES